MCRPNLGVHAHDCPVLLIMARTLQSHWNIHYVLAALQTAHGRVLSHPSPLGDLERRTELKDTVTRTTNYNFNSYRNTGLLLLYSSHQHGDPIARLTGLLEAEYT